MNQSTIQIPPTAQPDEKIISRFDYLEGPKSRTSEFVFTLNVLWQFIRSFRKLHFVGPCVTVFGSARFTPEDDYYKMAEALGAAIAKTGFTVMTGGGPGIMEAANKGAMEAGGASVGCNIRLPHEQKANDYMHEFVTLDYFFVRKLLLHKYSYAFVVLPGGWGTMDELFETLTLIQTGMVHHFPVVLMGREYYQPLIEYMDFMLNRGTISETDLRYVMVTDDVNEAVEHLRHYITSHYTIVRRRGFWFLGERNRIAQRFF